MVTDCSTKTLLSVIKSNVMVNCSTDQNKNKRIKTAAINFRLHKRTLTFNI